MCRNSVHKVPDLARPQCLINSEIYYKFALLTIFGRIHYNSNCAGGITRVCDVRRVEVG